MSLQQHLLSLGLPAIALCGAPAVSLSAQQPVTREQAVAAALARGARAAFGRADTAAASGALHAARLYPNPTALGSYSRDVPTITSPLIYRSTCPGSARLGSAPPRRRVTPPDTTSRSSAPRSGSTLIRPTPERSPPSPARVCPATTHSTPTACAKWRNCGAKWAT